MTNYAGKIVNSEEYRAHRREYMRQWRLRPENLERARATNRASRKRAKAADPTAFTAKERARYREYIARPEAQRTRYEKQRRSQDAGLYRRRGINNYDRHDYWLFQGGLCDFCGQPYPDPLEPGAWKHSVVDHDRDHCDRLIGCKGCVRAQGHRACNVAEGQIKRAVAIGLIDGFTGRLAVVLAEKPMQRWLASR